MTSASILALEPTVFFGNAETRPEAGTDTETIALRQLAYLNLENRGPVRELEVSIHSADFNERHSLGRVETGTGRHSLTVPDLQRPTPLTIGVWSGANLLDEKH